MEAQDVYVLAVIAILGIAGYFLFRGGSKEPEEYEEEYSALEEEVQQRMETEDKYLKYWHDRYQEEVNHLTQRTLNRPSNPGVRRSEIIEERNFDRW